MREYKLLRVTEITSPPSSLAHATHTSSTPSRARWRHYTRPHILQNIAWREYRCTTIHLAFSHVSPGFSMNQYFFEMLTYLFGLITVMHRFSGRSRPGSYNVSEVSNKHYEHKSNDEQDRASVAHP